MYDTVTPEQIREAARRAFTPGSRTIATLRKGSEEKAPRPAGSGG
jgi:predicted Zn-dependent peptidase